MFPTVTPPVPGGVTVCGQYTAHLSLPFSTVFVVITTQCTLFSQIMRQNDPIVLFFGPIEAMYLLDCRCWCERRRHCHPGAWKMTSNEWQLCSVSIIRQRTICPRAHRGTACLVRFKPNQTRTNTAASLCALRMYAWIMGGEREEESFL